MKVISKISDISWRLILSYAILVILLFSILFYFTSIYSLDNGLSKSNPTFFTSIYFSVVTFSSLGYGDIAPLGISRIFSMIEVILGLFFIGIIVSKIVSMRQETILTRIYHLEYIEHFRSIRHNLSIKRDDLKRVSSNLFHNPRNPVCEEEAKEIFKRKSNIFRQINCS